MTLTVDDGSGVVFADSQTVDEGGSFGFDLWNMFDLQRGQVLTVSDGTTTKVLTMHGLYVDGVDVVADTVFGRAEPGSRVQVWLHDTDVNLEVTADGAGNWVADLSGFVDLTYSSAGAAPPSWTTTGTRPRCTGGCRSSSSTSRTRTSAATAGRPTRSSRSSSMAHRSPRRRRTSTATSTSTSSSTSRAVSLVEVVGPMHTKSLLLGDPQVTAIDADADRVFGTAGAEVELDVWAAVDLWSESLDAPGDGRCRWRLDGGLLRYRPATSRRSISRSTVR